MTMHDAGRRVERLGQRALWAALALLFLGIGLQKLTAYEAYAVAPIAARSPLLGWVYVWLGPRGASALFAAIEIPTGVGLALGVARPTAWPARAAAAVAAITAFVTLSFVASTPGAFVRSHGLILLSLGVGQLFIKDVVLLAAAVTLFGAGKRADLSLRAAGPEPSSSRGVPPDRTWSSRPDGPSPMEDQLNEGEAILPAHIEQTVQAITRLHANHRRGATRLQRAVDRLARFFGRPRFVGVVAIVVASWIGANLLLMRAGLKAFDPVPFGGLQGITSLSALLMTILILISQRREDELTHLREQLTLELAILGEQKTAKVIELMEELRRDLPMVHDRSDPDAEILARPADPEAVLEALKERDEGPEPSMS